MRLSVPTAAGRSLLAISTAILLGSFGRAFAAPDDASVPPTLLTPAELDDLVAPVALYPDVVLDSLLPATVSQGDVTAAVAFVGAQSGDVASPAEDVGWAPSVVALLQFPDVLRWMGENPSWVERMGFAVAMQQADVLAAIQRYRATARAAGVLESSAYATVATDARAVIVIEPTDTNVVYVPIYDPWLLRQPYAYSADRPFFRSWLSFSFGERGFWARHRIFWGVGIYGFGDAWWWGSWRSGAADWGVARPTLWAAPSRFGQSWNRTGFSPSFGSRPGALRGNAAGTRSRVTYVTPPSRRMSGRSDPRSGTGSWTPGVREGWQPTSPAAPITRWRRSPASGSVAPRVDVPRVDVPRTNVPRTAPRRPVIETPTVIDRRTVNGWARRGSGSLNGGTRPAPSVPRADPVPRAAPTPRGTAPDVRSFPPRRAPTPAANGPRVRASGQRGRRSLNGS